MKQYAKYLAGGAIVYIGLSHQAGLSTFLVNGSKGGLRLIQGLYGKKVQNP